MAKFNARGAGTAVKAPAKSFITTPTTPTGRTGQGAPGFARDAKSELFLLSVMNFVGEDTFYEGALERDNRFKALVRAVATEDPAWVQRWVLWLRTEGNMRSASVVAALEGAAALLARKQPGGRQLVASALKRADEPGEALSYWFSTYGRTIPKPIKRGIADAARGLYTEYNWLKWDSDKSQFRFADVIELCHVDPGLDPVRNILLKHIVDSRHDHGKEIPSALTMIRGNDDLRALAIQTPHILTDTELLRAAGFTWEDALSLLGSVAKEPLRSQLKARVWAAIVPNMGYMALLRNLRNISQEISDFRVKQSVAARIADPDQVLRSKQFPYRFLSAHKAVSDYAHDWAPALEQALAASVSNIPALPGRTLILVDVSSSMRDRLSAKSDMNRAEAAGLFGAVLALRNQGSSTLVKFDDRSEEVPVPRNGSVLQLARTFQPRGGTYPTRAVQQHYQGHDRVVIITDEQGADGDPGRAIPPSVPLYVWGLGGYKYSPVAGTPNRHAMGGLTDGAFRIIPLLEAGISQNWPF